MADKEPTAAEKAKHLVNKKSGLKKRRLFGLGLVLYAISILTPSIGGWYSVKTNHATVVTYERTGLRTVESDVPHRAVRLGPQRGGGKVHHVGDGGGGARFKVERGAVGHGLQGVEGGVAGDRGHPINRSKRNCGGARIK